MLAVFKRYDVASCFTVRKGEETSPSGKRKQEVTPAYQSRILNNGSNPNCRLCTEREETVDPIVSVCPTILILSISKNLIEFHLLEIMQKLQPAPHTKIIWTYPTASYRKYRNNNSMGLHYQYR